MAQGLPEEAGRREPLPARKRHRPIEGGRYPRIHPASALVEAPHGSGGGEGQALLRCGTLVRIEPRSELEERGANGPHVGLLVYEIPPPLGLLGRHEAHCPEHRVQARDSRLRRLGLAPEPKIEHFELAAPRSKQVLRLDVTVQNALIVGRLNNGT